MADIDNDNEDEVKSGLLTNEIIEKNLSEVKRTIDRAGFAFTSLNISNKDIEELGSAIAKYEHLRYFNVSSNKLKNINIIKNLTSLLTIEATGNMIINMKPFLEEGKLKYLQVINLKNNKIKTLTALKSPRLRLVNLSENEITQIDSNFNGNNGLKELNLSKNKLLKLERLNNMPNLEKLILSENIINCFGHEGGLENLPKLSYLDMSKNPINKISEEFLPLLENLAVIDFQSTKFVNPEELSLLNNPEKLPLLRNLNVLDSELVNQLAEASKLELLIICPKLDILNTEEINDNDRQESYNLAEKKYEEEKRRKAEEERLAKEKELQDQEIEDKED